MLKPGTYSNDHNLWYNLPPGTVSAYTTLKGTTGNPNDVIFRLAGWYGISWEHSGGVGTGDCRGGAECRYIEFDGIFWDGSFRDPSSSMQAPMFKLTGGYAFYAVDTCWNDWDSTDCPGAGLVRFRNFHWKGGVTNQNTGLIDTNSQAMGLLGCFQCEFINGEVEQMVYGMYLTGERNLVDGVYFHDNLAMGIQIYDNGSEPCHSPGCTYNYAETPHHSIVRNSRFSRNGIYSGSQCYISPPQLVVAGPGVQVYNNLFDNGVATPCNPSGPASILVFSWCDQCLVYNNTFDHQNMGIYISGGTRARIYNNAASNLVGNGGSDNPTMYENNLIASVYGNSGNGRFTSSNNLVSSSPGWVDIAAGNAQLTSSSPFRDGGLNLSTGQGTDQWGYSMNIPAVDANSVARSGTWDIGACEWFSGAGPCY